MARYLGPKCRLCRREGKKLFLKGSRCFSPKCPLDRKGAVPPGQHGTKVFGRYSDYLLQLREKQKAKRMYGVMERQFQRYFAKATKAKEETGRALLQILESRLDNVVFRLGFTPSRSLARQLVSHGHILVDGKKVNVSSYALKPGQVISIASRGLKIKEVKASLDDKGRKIPSWLERKAAVGRVKNLPTREEIDFDIDEDLIVNFYSR